MRRRSKAGGKQVKKRLRKTVALKRREAPKARRSFTITNETEVVRLTRALHDAQEQQTATSEVLKVISASPSALQPVLEVVARSAARFCEADDVTIFERDGENLHAAAHWGVVPQEVGVRFPCVRGQVSGRAVLERRPVRVTDLQAEAEEFPEGSAFARRFGHRTTAGVPLLREGVALGAILLRRAEVKPFTNKQITLLETFAAQAVIAIENARLLNELRQRTADLSESLEHQTATSDVLDLISRTPTDIQPVFNAIAKSAVRLCGGLFGVVWRYDSELLHCAANHNFTPDVLDRIFKSYPKPPDRSLAAGRAILDGKIIHVADMLADPEYA